MSTESALPTVLQEEIAERIIENVKNTISYPINIMDRQGVIIASTNPTRVGTFHAIAWRIINSTSDLIECYSDDTMAGTRPGVNIALKHDGQKIGVLGITGDPEVVLPFVQVLKLAVETMLEFELEQQKSINMYTQQQHLESGFLYGMISEENLRSWASEISLDSSTYRVPIMFRTDQVIDFPRKMNLLQRLREAPYASGQDFFTQWPRKEFTLFKAMKSQESMVKEYRQLISDFVQPFAKAIGESGYALHISVGSFCNDFTAYHKSSGRARWLMDSLLSFHTDSSPYRIEYFYDYIREWIDTFLPATELREIYFFFETAGISEKQMDRMTQLREALTRNNFNLMQTSKDLYVHKNTLSNWISDIDDIFGLDLVHEIRDRIFWKYLSSYYAQKKGS